MSQYFDVEPNNVSWLKSNGQWNSKALYPSYYDWILTNVNGGVEGFKKSTDTSTDYDFVINTANETFRLPLLDGSEDLTGTHFDELQPLPSGSTYIAPANGTYRPHWYPTGIGGSINVLRNNIEVYLDRTYGDNIDWTETFEVPVKKGDVIKIIYGAAVLDYLYFYPAIGNGSLYFYVGETIQDANVINASGVLTRVADLSDSYISGLGMPSRRYINLTLGASGSTYTAPANGYVFINKTTGVTNAYITIDALNISSGVICQLPFADNALKAFMPLRKGQQFKVYYNATGATNAFCFIYAE